MLTSDHSKSETSRTDPYSLNLSADSTSLLNYAHQYLNLSKSVLKRKFQSLPPMLCNVNPKVLRSWQEHRAGWGKSGPPGEVLKIESHTQPVEWKMQVSFGRWDYSRIVWSSIDTSSHQYQEQGYSEILNSKQVERWIRAQDLNSEGRRTVGSGACLQTWQCILIA